MENILDREKSKLAGDAPALRFITCGSVDDGKSTLVGRLLYDSELLLDDQLEALKAESKIHGTTGGNIDFALLLDGLQAEREQGITIDIAYRFFATKRRRFIVADTPGHEQYTRNMATGASNAELAIVLVDARKGVITQTLRHSYILGLFGVRHIVLAINKMDLVGWDSDRFQSIVDEYCTIGARLGIPDITCIPICARDGDNIFSRSERMPWYVGPTIVEHLEKVEVLTELGNLPFRLPVQWVNRPNADFRGFSGRVANGVIHQGHAIASFPSGRVSKVTRILTADGDDEIATEGQAVTLVLADEIDASRGDILAPADAAPIIADEISGHIVWFDDAAMIPGRRYTLKSAGRKIGAVISKLKHRVNVNTLDQQAATALSMNEIGCVTINLEGPLVCDPYRENRETGGFILIDTINNHTVAAGVIDSARRHAADVKWQNLNVDVSLRARIKYQRPCVLWFTGLVGSGRSTVANLVEQRLCDLGRHTYLLDGHNLRHDLNRDLDFSTEARVESVRRAAIVAKLLYDAGLITLVAMLSPLRVDRQMARDLIGDGNFIEVHMATPLDECERRDPGGLYQRARTGDLPNFTGVDAPYEPPESPEISIDTTGQPPEIVADRVVAYLKENGYL
ncbi:MAG TPA: sulfate adenylyltransferase subunit CysN [Xanthobacteraceae bacterium]|jgi:bifunctional enzyme CysN/CysC|nr:sulfate adenylyltransferase subunit CysN [Xanthobacteraceae bacterium]